jgi:ankyrin repeat protein
MCCVARAQNGWTPLHMAAWNGRVSVVPLLLERGADKEAKTNVRHAVRPCPRRSAQPPSLR